MGSLKQYYGVPLSAARTWRVTKTMMGDTIGNAFDNTVSDLLYIIVE